MAYTSHSIRHVLCGFGLVAVLMSGTAFAAECVRPAVSGYKKVGCLSDGLAQVSKDHKFGFVDADGKVVIPLKFDHAADFKEGLSHAKKGGKKGYIDTQGKTVIPFEYDFANDFENGIAKVNKGEEWFYIDKTGQRVKEIEK